MIGFLKRLFKDQENISLPVQDNFKSTGYITPKTRIRHHALVVGDTVKVSKIIEITRYEDKVRKFKLSMSTGVVIDVIDSLSCYVYMDDESFMICTEPKHTIERVTITDPLRVGDTVRYTSVYSLRQFGSNTTWYNATIEHVYEQGSYLIKTEKGYIYHRNQPEYIFKRIKP